ncbi:MAG: CAAX prenyl protease-related protein [Bryobacteraceae bacterium]
MIAPVQVVAETRSSFPYVAPFAAFLGLLAIGNLLPIPQEVNYPVRVALVSVVLWVFSKGVISLRVSNWMGSVLLGIGVFLVWVGPEFLWPEYRRHGLFSNSLLGTPATSLPGTATLSLSFLVIRAAGSALLVPIVEELFWRAWLMRWIIDNDFWKVPLGTYATASFWLTAVLFASEHGPYWEVGLIAGIAYNWWMIRTASLGDCILSHAVTNACLAAYVVGAKQWQYWGL